MAGFTIPNTPDAVNANQAEPDSLDFQILGNHKNAVVSGMGVTPAAGSNPPTVAVASGEVLINGAYYTYAGIANLGLNSYSTLPFFDIIVARLSGSTITCYAIAGDADTNPRYPKSPALTDNDVVLAAVWRPNNSAISDAGLIVDKRLLVRSTGSRVSSSAPSGGNSGDTWVNTSWSSDTTQASPLSVKVGSTWYQVAKYSSNFSAGTITATFSGNLTGNVTGNVSGSAGSVAWNGVTGKPDIVYNNSGTYNISINGNASSASTANVANSANDVAWSNVSGKPSIVYNDGGTYGINISGNAAGLSSSLSTLYSNSYGWVAGGWLDTPVIFAGYVDVDDGSATSPSYRFADADTGMYHLASDGTGSSSKIRFTVNGTYAYVITTSGGANASSLRYKENVQPADVNTADLLNIEIMTFNMKGKDQDITGVIAEQLDSLESCKQFVIYDGDGQPDAVAYDRLAVAYISLLKDHEERLKALEAQ